MLDGRICQKNFFLIRINHIRRSYRINWFGDGSDPTTFELLTLTALIAFRKAGCQWLVLETGLGGRLDATNIVTPEISVITSIELEHTRLLGNTIREVAAEKGGIIKNGVPILLGDLNPEAVSPLTKNCTAPGKPSVYRFGTSAFFQSGRFSRFPASRWSEYTRVPGIARKDTRVLTPLWPPGQSS